MTEILEATNGIEVLNKIPLSIKDMINAEKAKIAEDTVFTFGKFDLLYLSAKEFQFNVTRNINGQSINSLPIDMELQLSKLLSKMKQWFEPYEKAQLSYAKSLGFSVNDNGSIHFTPILKDTDKEKRAIIEEERTTKVTAIQDMKREMDSFPFEEKEELFKLLPLSLFTEQRIKESEILFNNCPNKQQFLQYCVVNK